MTASLIETLWPVSPAGLFRVGRDHDGGYIVPRAAFAAAEGLLSFGLKFDWSFEAAFSAAHLSAPVHSYDPTVGPLRFVRIGLSSLPGSAFSRNKRERVRACFDYFLFFRGGRRHFREWIGVGDGRTDVITAARRLGGLSNIFVKMDIEGAEYEVLPQLVALGGRMVCLVVELHDVTSHEAEITDFIQAMKETHAVTHLHANNHAQMAKDGVTPNVLEVTIAKRSLLPASMEPYQDHLPVPGLDQPNNARVPDYALRRTRA